MGQIHEDMKNGRATNITQETSKPWQPGQKRQRVSGSAAESKRRGMRAVVEPLESQPPLWCRAWKAVVQDWLETREKKLFRISEIKISK